MTGSAVALSKIKDRLAPFETGPLRTNVRAHYEHLHQLAESLRRIGLDDDAIDREVIEIFESYKQELLRNIARIEDQARFDVRLSTPAA